MNFFESVKWGPSYSMCMDGRTDSHHESNTRFTVICVVPDIVHSLIYSKERSFLEKLTGFGLSRNSPQYMESVSPLPQSQVPATCPYPETSRFSP